MSGYLLDTNVVSEIFRGTPDLQVRSFLAEQEELWLPVIALHELEFGLNLLSTGTPTRRPAHSSVILRRSIRRLHPAGYACRS